MAEFLIRALLAGVGVAVVAGPVGCFVVWRRMVFFGAAMAHTALLGVALGVVLGIGVTPAAMLVCAAAAAVVAILSADRRLPDESILGVVAHGALALALVVIAASGGLRFEVLAFLFGDILAVTTADLIWIWVCGAAVLALLAVLWRPLLALTIHDELAAVEDVPVAAVRVIFLLAVAVVTAASLKVVGGLLIVSMLIIPAAAARRLSSTPEAMAVWAAILGVIAVFAGLTASIVWDAPAGPAIVLAAVLLFVAGFAAPQRLSRPR